MLQPNPFVPRRSQAKPYAVEFQPCERRLVLSAQMLFDVLGDQALQMHVLEQPDSNTLDTLPIENHASAAHQLTGWQQVQQQFGLTGKGQTVAVIDSGIAWDHVALGKGFGAGYRVVGGWDFSEENDARPYDDGPTGFHGTHVAGIIGSDDPTRTGVAPDVDLVALRVFNDAGQGQIGWVEKALQWVHANRNSFENPITTVNLSLGTTWNATTVPDWGTLEEELRTLYNDGIVVTASAGNSFKQYNAPGLSYPAASPYVLPVASVDDNGQLSDFSQRSDQVIAAPGRNIVSTVPDHLLGRDGKVNDFSTASGTSMAAPYVAGASVLVRQAMEMAGWNDISLDTIADHLHNTADKVFDSITKASYSRLDLQQAIDAIIPDDVVGDTNLTARHLLAAQGELNTASNSTGRLSGWINSLDDVDVYQFTAAANGKLQIDADSRWLDSLQWSLTSDGRTIESGTFDAESVNLTAGRSYELRVDADREIGTFEFGFSFQVDSSANSGSNGNSGQRGITDLGAVDYWQQAVASSGIYRVQATHDGLMTVVWENTDAPHGSLSVLQGSAMQTDATWEIGSLRLDLQARAGEWFEVRLPGVAGDQGELTFANVVGLSNRELQVHGTSEGDALAVNLQNGVRLQFEDIVYAFSFDQVSTVHIDGAGAADQIQITGSSQAESMELRSSVSNLSSQRIQLSTRDIEQIDFVGGGGADSAYLYDTDGDDTLTARPNQVEMDGAGYRFQVRGASRIFVHATAGGTDVGFFYDSVGNDKLSIRPQFSSMNGEGYFNYISGVERVYAYATAGGHDVVDIYDSAGNDRFIANGDTASTFGSGFTSYTKGFERVNAYASAGGNDIAQLYAQNAKVQWLQGADFVSFEEQATTREARGFETVERYVSGQLLVRGPATQAVAMLAALSAEPDAIADFSSAFDTSDSVHNSSHGFAPAVATSPNSDRCYAFDSIRSTLDEPPREEPATSWQSLTVDHVELNLLDSVNEMLAWTSRRLDRQEDNRPSEIDLERRILDELFSQFEEQ